MVELSDYGPGHAGDSRVTALARLQQAWFRREVLGIDECGISPQTKRPLQSFLPEGHAADNFLTPCAFEYAEHRILDSTNRPELTIIASRLRHNMLSSQPMCFNLFSDLRSEVEQNEGSVQRVVAAMFPEVPVASVDDVIVEEVPTVLASQSAVDKTGWDAVIRCNSGGALITIETKYTDQLDPLAPTRGNDALFDVAERVFTKDGLDYYRHLRRKAPQTKDGVPRPPLQEGGFDQVARNLLLTLRYAERQGIEAAVNYVLAPAFDDEAETKVNQLRGRLQERWRQHVRFRTLDNVVQAGLPYASPRLGQVLSDFTTRYLDLNPARHLLGEPALPYPPESDQRGSSEAGG